MKRTIKFCFNRCVRLSYKSTHKVVLQSSTHSLTHSLTFSFVFFLLSPNVWIQFMHQKCFFVLSPFLLFIVMMIPIITKWMMRASILSTFWQRSSTFLLFHRIQFLFQSIWITSNKSCVVDGENLDSILYAKQGSVYTYSHTCSIYDLNLIDHTIWLLSICLCLCVCICFRALPYGVGGHQCVLSFLHLLFAHCFIIVRMTIRSD